MLWVPWKRKEQSRVQGTGNVGERGRLLFFNQGEPHLCILCTATSLVYFPSAHRVLRPVDVAVNRVDEVLSLLELTSYWAEWTVNR